MAAAERQQAWEFYYAWLANETSSGVFGESFSLEEIYVPLRAFTVARKVDGATSLDQIEASGRINAPATPVRTVFDLDEHLDEWVDSGSATDSIA
jgi:hypothetical protein